MKLIGNYEYGSLIMNVEKFQNIKYARVQKNTFSKIKSTLFQNVTELDYELFTFQMAEKVHLKLLI